VGEGKIEEGFFEFIKGDDLLKGQIPRNIEPRAMDFAQAAIRQLRRISDDDMNRLRAFQFVLDETLKGFPMNFDGLHFIYKYLSGFMWAFEKTQRENDKWAKIYLPEMHKWTTDLLNLTSEWMKNTGGACEPSG
jgi:hypothetical protein